MSDHFKTYTIATNKKVVHLTAAKRIKEDSQSTSYDSPAEVKEVDLVEIGEDPKLVYIAKDLTTAKEQELIALLKEFKDCFAWKYTEMKGVPPDVNPILD